MIFADGYQLADPRGTGQSGHSPYHGFGGGGLVPPSQAVAGSVKSGWIVEIDQPGFFACVARDYIKYNRRIYSLHYV